MPLGTHLKGPNRRSISVINGGGLRRRLGSHCRQWRRCDRSTGGRARLDFIAGARAPGVAALQRSRLRRYAKPLCAGRAMGDALDGKGPSFHCPPRRPRSPRVPCSRASFRPRALPMRAGCGANTIGNGTTSRAIGSARRFWNSCRQAAWRVAGC